MTESIIVALITGAFTLVGTIIATRASAKKTDKTIQTTLQTAQAVTDVKIDELTREVREHNNFARRVPVLEEQSKDFRRRIERLENNQ